jgi:hypothetical protein
MKHLRIVIHCEDHQAAGNRGRGKHVGTGEPGHCITASELPVVLDALRAYRGVTVRDEVLDDLIDKLDVL